ncbi:hypothetical protein RIF29_14479 [Crotalaria pallida]|uniref:Uncharacterized protein n=1 Tax=Crotalaria pallida TaxID=3830 RepID=A0AAN9IDT2_CROPI
MAKKKGKASATNTPSPSSSNRPEEEHFDPVKSLASLDLSVLDEEDIAGIDNLSAKEADSLIQTLETLKARLKGKGKKASIAAIDNEKGMNDQLMNDNSSDSRESLNIQMKTVTDKKEDYNRKASMEL